MFEDSERILEDSERILEDLQVHALKYADKKWGSTLDNVLKVQRPESWEIKDIVRMHPTYIGKVLMQYPSYEYDEPVAMILAECLFKFDRKLIASFKPYFDLVMGDKLISAITTYGHHDYRDEYEQQHKKAIINLGELHVPLNGYINNLFKNDWEGFEWAIKILKTLPLQLKWAIKILDTLPLQLVQSTVLLMLAQYSWYLRSNTLYTQRVSDLIKICKRVKIIPDLYKYTFESLNGERPCITDAISGLIFHETTGIGIELLQHMLRAQPDLVLDSELVDKLISQIHIRTDPKKVDMVLKLSVHISSEHRETLCRRRDFINKMVYCRCSNTQ